MIYKVTYQSMSAFYGPSFIEAEDEYEAKKIFAGNAFNKNEYGLINAIPSSFKEYNRYVNNNNME